MGKIYEMWIDAESPDENIRNAALQKIAECGYSYGLAGIIQECIEKKNPFSLVRLGDGELAILSQLYKTTEEVHKNWGWSRSTAYCGVDVPSMDFVRRMVESIKNATIVGVFEGDPLNKEVFNHLGFYPQHRCHAFENLYLPMRKDFVSILRKYPPLLIGRRSKEYATFLKEQINIDVPGCIGIESYHDIDNVLKQALEISDNWDWALVSAGCCADVIAAELDYIYGKIALDSGHMFDNILAKWEGYWLNTEL